MKIFLSIFRVFFVYVLLCSGTFLIARVIVQYTSFEPDVAFLAVKQDYIHIPWWKAAFYIHVFSCIFTLLAGFTQFTNDLPGKRLHRVMGRFYVYNILFINFPVAMIMAFYANGLLPSRIAFITLDCLWAWFTLKAVMMIKKGDVAAHRRFMIRSFALTCSAITLRSWKMVLGEICELNPVTLYMIIAWLGFVPNLLFAEWYIRTSASQVDKVQDKKREQARHHDESEH